MGKVVGVQLRPLPQSSALLTGEREKDVPFSNHLRGNEPLNVPIDRFLASVRFEHRSKLAQLGIEIGSFDYESNKYRFESAWQTTHVYPPTSATIMQGTFFRFYVLATYNHYSLLIGVLIRFQQCLACLYLVALSRVVLPIPACVLQLDKGCKPPTEQD